MTPSARNSAPTATASDRRVFLESSLPARAARVEGLATSRPRRRRAAAIPFSTEEPRRGVGVAAIPFSTEEPRRGRGVAGKALLHGIATSRPRPVSTAATTSPRPGADRRRNFDANVSGPRPRHAAHRARASLEGAARSPPRSLAARSASERRDQRPQPREHRQPGPAVRRRQVDRRAARHFVGGLGVRYGGMDGAALWFELRSLGRLEAPARGNHQSAWTTRPRMLRPLLGSLGPCRRVSASRLGTECTTDTTCRGVPGEQGPRWAAARRRGGAEVPCALREPRGGVLWSWRSLLYLVSVCWCSYYLRASVDEWDDVVSAKQKEDIRKLAVRCPSNLAPSASPPRESACAAASESKTSSPFAAKQRHQRQLSAGSTSARWLRALY